MNPAVSEGVNVALTQHISGYPASFHSESVERPEDQQGHVVRSHGHQDPCNPVQQAGHQEAHLPAKPEDRRRAKIRLKVSN